MAAFDENPSRLVAKFNAIVPSFNQIHMGGGHGQKQVGVVPEVAAKGSYANAVRGTLHTGNGNTSPPGNISSPNMELKFIKPTCENGRVKVQPPEGVAAAGSGEWENALVGYFVGHKLPFPTVNTIAHNIWGKSGLEEVLSSENGFFLFKFKDHDNMCSVMERAPWHMAKKPLVLKKWQPNLSLAKEEIQTVPIWVRLFNVPLEFWTSTGLSYIASAVGKPLHVDKFTASKKRISYVRVCVEVNASDELVNDFDLQCADGNWITIHAEFEWTPTRCKACEVFGHSISSFSKLKPSPSNDGKPGHHLPAGTMKRTVTKGDNRSEVWVEVKRKGKGKEVVELEREKGEPEHDELSNIAGSVTPVMDADSNDQRATEIKELEQGEVHSSSRDVDALALDSSREASVIYGSPSDDVQNRATKANVSSMCSGTDGLGMESPNLGISYNMGNDKDGEGQGGDKPEMQGGEITPAAAPSGPEGHETSASPDLNPLGGKAKDSLEKNKKGSGSKKKNKNKKYFSPKGGRWR